MKNNHELRHIAELRVFKYRLDVLEYLLKYNAQSMLSISSDLGYSYSGVQIQIKRLELFGIVNLIKTGRCYNVTLTPKGKEFAETGLAFKKKYEEICWMFIQRKRSDTKAFKAL